MRNQIIFFLISTSIPFSQACAATSIYCPENHGYINTGMTRDQVMQACGQPSSITQSTQPAMQKVPVTQLIYSNIGQGAMYSGYNSTYQMWSLPSGSTQMHMEISVMNNKISAISINGSSSNAMTLCKGQSIQIGSDPNDVYSACGAPSEVNQTYVLQAVPGRAKPEVWVYNPGQYQPSINLTFLNGVLQSIN